MRTVVRYRIAFNAAHQLPVANHWCSPHLHGHDWSVEMTTIATVDPKTGEHADSTPVLEASVAELDGHFLNEMLPGVHPTAAGVAGFLAERMRLEVPGLVSITVGHTDHSVTVEV